MSGMSSKWRRSGKSAIAQPLQLAEFLIGAESDPGAKAAVAPPVERQATRDGFGHEACVVLPEFAEMRFA